MGFFAEVFRDTFSFCSDSVCHPGNRTQTYMLLRPTNRLAFTGSPAEALKFYASVGYPIPPHTNPADFFIQTLAIVPGDEAKCTERATKFTNAVSYYRRSQQLVLF